MPQHERHAVDRIVEAVRDSLHEHVPVGAPIAVALSGGRDSLTLLDILAGLGPPRGHALSAIHVHHGLSPRADAWAGSCASACQARGVALIVRRVTVAPPPGGSVEAEARRVRYLDLVAAARSVGAGVVALAHHRDDQAETVLLQLLRGAGPHGLAAMAELRHDGRQVDWWRPLLSVSRADIDAYAAGRSLHWIDDESNRNVSHRRNALRHIVLPAIAEAGFASVSATLARAAQHQADAMRLADDVARLDASTAYDGTSLDRAALQVLPDYRARNLLRWFLRSRGLAAPPETRLRAILAQVTAARADARVRLAHAGVEVGVFRGRVHVHAPAPPAVDVAWHGEPMLFLPHGSLEFAAGSTGAIDPHRLAGAPMHVRVRCGGERLQLAPGRPRRALKAIFQEQAVPPWVRESVPLLFCGDRLVAAAGIGVDVAFQAEAGGRGLTMAWHPYRI